MTTSNPDSKNGEPEAIDIVEREKPDALDDAGNVARSIPGTNVASMFWWMQDVSILPAGRHWRRFTLRDTDNVRKIFHNSQVFVSMSELSRDMSGCIVGDAAMAVLNVVPEFRTVSVRYHLDWDWALPVRFNILIVN
ncbi:hypothetical protein [Bradyrhizobium liaoningense]|uniref:hypothetical protein n=1 Tax=Bradyrhizobium liaoningense TaxID=43992 RepID=UPI001BA4AEE6|nr:hypothetical protein [Bradyrhizobium liaoningense]MBR0854338.1 hypothetical protein [Bradyrhizobium liaoningense]